MQEPKEMQIQSLDQEMATHSSILVWRIPRTEEPGRLQSIGLQWVGHNWRDFARMTARLQKPAKEREEPPALPEVTYFSNNALGQTAGQRSSQESPKVLHLLRRIYLAYEKRGLCTKVLS